MAVHKAFEYHQPTPEMVVQMTRVREALDAAMTAMKSYVPSCAEQTLAIRKLEEASMWANKAIVFNGERYL